jgi:hypothetical protein
MKSAVTEVQRQQSLPYPHLPKKWDKFDGAISRSKQRGIISGNLYYLLMYQDLLVHAAAHT